MKVKETLEKQLLLLSERSERDDAEHLERNYAPVSIMSPLSPPKFYHIGGEGARAEAAYHLGA